MICGGKQKLEIRLLFFFRTNGGNEEKQSQKAEKETKVFSQLRTPLPPREEDNAAVPLSKRAETEGGSICDRKTAGEAAEA